MNSILALVGVAVGWGLKVFSDYVVATIADQKTFRKAAFYILKDYKALLDYDRATTYFRKQRPGVEVYEPWRAILQARFLHDSGANAESTSTAIELLASVDPTLAMRLHNTLRNMAFAFRKDLGKVAIEDPETYVQLVYSQDKLVAFTLKDVHDAALQIAQHAGFGQRKKVQAWIREREAGESEFVQGMEEQAELRDRAMALGQRGVSEGA
jgi:hypothetical protein